MATYTADYKLAAFDATAVKVASFIVAAAYKASAWSDSGKMPAQVRFVAAYKEASFGQQGGGASTTAQFWS